MEWIACSEKKPESIKPVLALYKSEKMKRAYPLVAQFIRHKTVRSENFLSDECDPGDLDWYDADSDCYWVNEGWFETSIISDMNYSLGNDITHWMEIPESIPPGGRA